MTQVEKVRDTRSKYSEMRDKIIAMLKESGISSKDAIKESINPDMTPRDKEYFMFHAAWSALHNQGKIAREDPTDGDSDWIVKEDGDK